jgi:hypothetical protein
VPLRSMLSEVPVARSSKFIFRGEFVGRSLPTALNAAAAASPEDKAWRKIASRLSAAGSRPATKVRPEDFSGGRVRFHTGPTVPEWAPSHLPPPERKPKGRPTDRQIEYRSADGFLDVPGAVDSDTGVFLFQRIPRDEADRYTQAVRAEMLSVAQQATTDKKRAIGRGVSCGSSDDGYSAHGFRAGQGNRFGAFAHQNDADQPIVDRYIDRFQSASEKYIPKPVRQAIYTTFASHECRLMGGTSATQCRARHVGALSFGKNYWSSSHIDGDFYLTFLSVLSGASQDVVLCDAITQYFCFPEYGLKVALHSGDLIIFNPLIAHSCTQPLLPESYIFSCYLNKNTAIQSADHGLVRT